MKKLELQDYKKKNKNLLAKSYSRFEPVGVGYLLVCKHFYSIISYACAKKKQTLNNQPKKKQQQQQKNH